MLDREHATDAAKGARQQRNPRENLVAIAIVSRRCHEGDRFEAPHVEELSASGEFRVTVPIPKEAVIPNPVESRRQHVEQKPTDEFGRGQRHRLLGLRAVGAVVLIAEADVAVVDIDQPRVGDGDAMGVAADVVEHLLRTRKRRFRVDDPFSLPGRLQMIGKATRLRQGLECPGEPELAHVERVVQIAEEEPTEEAREHPDGEKEASSAGDPSGAVVREAAAGDHAVELRMKDERLSPRVEHGEEPDLGAQLLRVSPRSCGGSRPRLETGWRTPRLCSETRSRRSVPAR